MREGLLEAVTKAMLSRLWTQAGARPIGDATGRRRRPSGPGDLPAGCHRAAARRPRRSRTCSASSRPKRAPIRASARWRCSVCAEARCAPCSTGRQPPARPSGTVPAVALDLSALRAGLTSSDLAMSIEMVCASAVLDAKRTQRAREADARGHSAPKVIRVNDEAWQHCRSRASGSTTRPRSSSAATPAYSTGSSYTARQTSEPGATRAVGSSVSPRPWSPTPRRSCSTTSRQPILGSRRSTQARVRFAEGFPARRPLPRPSGRRPLER
jgi:hypothetical protein